MRRTSRIVGASKHTAVILRSRELARRLEGSAAGTAFAAILRGSPKHAMRAPQDDGGGASAMNRRYPITFSK
jgi:hypothetical protein